MLAIDGGMTREALYIETGALFSDGSEQKPFQLKLVGFSDSDKVTFESILFLSENRLDKFWQITLEKDNIDFYILSQRLRSQFHQNKLLQTLPREQCIFCVVALSNEAEHELLVDKNNIPLLRPLVTLFNQLSSSMPAKQPEPLVNNFSVESNVAMMPQSANDSQPNLKPRSLGFFEKFPRSKSINEDAVRQEFAVSQHDKPISSAKDKNIIHIEESDDTTLLTEITESNDNTFDPAHDPFIRRLLDGSIEKKLFFSLSNANELYVDLQNRCYYSADKLEKLQIYFTCQGKFSLQELTDNQLQAVVNEKALKLQPLNNLLWYAAFCCSQGKVNADYQQNDIVRLKRWPDINVPCCRKLIKLAAYMHSNSVNLQTIQAETNLAMGVVHDFYNACKAIGLIELCQEQDVHEKTMNKEQRELYAKIGKRITAI